ncbi:MAG: vanadium-dependent haloperoxidase [Saprospiraceae bacterium]|nr:vanadium-dependent haloperoxidase [Saprospiraceae bacterium]
MFRYVLAAFTLAALFSCKNENKDYAKVTNDATVYHGSVKALTDVIVHDIFSPPVASRIYSYASIAGYEGARYGDSTYRSLAGQIPHLVGLPTPEANKEYCWPMVSSLAFLQTGKTLIFSEDTLQAFITKTLDFYKNSGMPEEVYDRSAAFAGAISKHIIAWSGKDKYKESRSYPKYSLQKDPATWQPTPPGYMDGIEPSWNKIRTMVMDSASQFKPVPPPVFNVKDKNSPFFKEVLETYNTVKNADAEQTEIANFWDCNPYKLNVTGHVMHATKKISPGGHWINIVGVAGKKSQADYVKASASYAMVSIALFDAFVSCWDEKYRSLLVRPETVINEQIDPEWLPMLQTPPFPEYTSGHSVASSAASVVLTSIYGDKFAYDDDTEVEFGLPVRKFTSFDQAAAEASISRLYGGIHYRSAIENGITQGKSIGSLVVNKIKLKGN